VDKSEAVAEAPRGPWCSASVTRAVVLGDRIVVTGWMGENNFAPAPTALYAVILLIAAIAYWILHRAIIAEQGETSLLAAAVGMDLKGKLGSIRSPQPANSWFVAVFEHAAAQLARPPPLSATACIPVPTSPSPCRTAPT
jgi:hypothetical protein